MCSTAEVQFLSNGRRILFKACCSPHANSLILVDSELKTPEFNCIDTYAYCSPCYQFGLLLSGSMPCFCFAFYSSLGFADMTDT